MRQSTRSHMPHRPYFIRKVATGTTSILFLALVRLQIMFPQCLPPLCRFLDLIPMLCRACFSQIVKETSNLMLLIGVLLDYYHMTPGRPRSYHCAFLRQILHVPVVWGSDRGERPPTLMLQSWKPRRTISARRLSLRLDVQFLYLTFLGRLCFLVHSTPMSLPAWGYFTQHRGKWSAMATWSTSVL